MGKLMLYSCRFIKIFVKGTFGNESCFEKLPVFGKVKILVSGIMIMTGLVCFSNYSPQKRINGFEKGSGKWEASLLHFLWTIPNNVCNFQPSYPLRTHYSKSSIAANNKASPIYIIIELKCAIRVLCILSRKPD